MNTVTYLERILQIFILTLFFPHLIYFSPLTHTPSNAFHFTIHTLTHSSHVLTTSHDNKKPRTSMFVSMNILNNQFYFYAGEFILAQRFNAPSSFHSHENQLSTHSHQCSALLQPLAHIIRNLIL